MKSLFNTESGTRFDLNAGLDIDDQGWCTGVTRDGTVKAVNGPPTKNMMTLDWETMRIGRGAGP